MSDTKTAFYSSFVVLFFVAVLGAESLIGTSHAPDTYKRVLGTQASTGLECPQVDCIYYWESILKNNPEYTDGYLYLSTLYWQKSDIINAQKTLKHAELLGLDSDLFKSLKIIF